MKKTMANDIESLFSGSRIQVLNNGQKNIYSIVFVAVGLQI